MKREKFLHGLAMLFVTMLCVCVVSCGDDDDDFEQTETVSSQDPTGTIVLNMNAGAIDNYYEIADWGYNGRFHIDEANNFRGYDVDRMSFVSLGKVGGLGKISSIPSIGWAKSAAVVPGNGYVVRYGWNGSYQYARIYVIDYLGYTTDDLGNGGSSITGATIKYQAPFMLAIKLETNSLSFDSEGGLQKVKLTNPTNVEIVNWPEWCSVSATEDAIIVSASENLTAQQRSGEIVLKNSENSVKLNVMQKAASSPTFQGGSGTVTDPYQITNAQQLKYISKALYAHFVLTADISLNEEAAGSGWDPIGKQEAPFTGTLDGQGHTIKNMWMKRPTTNGVGLFGYISGATITGIRLEISSTGLTGGQYVGGICGYASGVSSISKCSVKGTLSGKDYVGGLCGGSNKSYSQITVSECYSEGSYTCDDNYVSGIVGLAYTNFYISNCYSIASLSGYRCDGISVNGNHTKCYFAGQASPSNIFLCGGTYTYFDQSVIGTTKLGSKENARTTSQMKTQSNYEGWDFTSIWKINEGKTYPTLRCFDK